MKEINFKLLFVLVIFVFLIFSCPVQPDAKKESVSSTQIQNWVSRLKITAFDAADIDYFGNSAAISGDYAIVGAYSEDGSGTNRGAAYIFHRTGVNTWDGGIKIIASDAADNDDFGWSVAISGDYAIVGAYREDGAGNDRGTAYIFHRTGTNTWDGGIKIIASDAADGDNFGWSVAISGSYAILGAYNEDGAGTNRGAAYIFCRTGANIWDAGVKIIASDAADNDQFGYSVAISSDYAIAGAVFEDGAGIDRGAVYIFFRTGINTWDTGVKIIASDTADSDFFGSSVAISGDNAVVGAYREDGAGNNRGAAYIFHRIWGNIWTAGIKISASDAADNDEFGRSVAISGDYAVVGTPYKSEGIRKGASYIFHMTEIDTWDTGVKITASDAANDDFFGSSVTISDDYIIAGANGKDGAGSNRGAAYIFKK